MDVLDVLIHTVQFVFIAVAFQAPFQGLLRIIFGQWTSELARYIYFEIKPFVTTMFTVVLVLEIVHDFQWHNVVPTAVYIVAWQWIKRKIKDDDDRWKRRVERATGAVQDLGHRLTVVNEPATEGA